MDPRHNPSIPPEILLAEQRQRDRQERPGLTGLTELLRVPSLDGSPAEIAARYAPLLALAAAALAGLPLIGLFLGAEASSLTFATTMTSLVSCVTFLLAFIWLAERQTLGLVAAGVGLAVQTAASLVFASGPAAFGAVVGLVVGPGGIYLIRHEYGR